MAHRLSTRHSKAVTEGCRVIREIWPEASVALSGSLARRQATDVSDVDLLLVVPGARGSRHGWWPGVDTPYSFVVIAVPVCESTLREWATPMGGTLLNYVADATPLYDPHGHVRQLIDTARRFREELSRPGDQVEHVRSILQAFADHAQIDTSASPLSRFGSRSAAYQAGVMLWYLVRGDYPRDKDATLASVTRIRRHDPVYDEALSRLLRCAWSEFPAAIASLTGAD